MQYESVAKYIVLAMDREDLQMNERDRQLLNNPSIQVDGDKRDSFYVCIDALIRKAYAKFVHCGDGATTSARAQVLVLSGLLNCDRWPRGSRDTLCVPAHLAAK
ncbi:unnamed protein product [Lampetra planeri]